MEHADPVHHGQVFSNPCLWLVEIERRGERIQPVERLLFVLECTVSWNRVFDNGISFLLEFVPKVMILLGSSLAVSVCQACLLALAKTYSLKTVMEGYTISGTSRATGAMFESWVEVRFNFL